MQALELTAGQTIAERYRLIGLRGTGATGSVWRAVQLADQREVALKLLHRSAPEQRDKVFERFLREAKAALSIDSPHAVRVHDFGIDGEIPFLAMELLEGETLASRLHREGPLAPAELSRVVDQIASALGSAHELGIVHRDLKPENIFLAQGSQGVVAKVLDFGIAKLQDESLVGSDLTETGALLGTPRYMSPEQIEGARHVDLRADLWAMAVIAFECITGRQPFQGDNLRALFAAICMQPPPVPSTLCAVPRGFDAWFAKGTHRDAGKRFRSAAALADALRRVCEQELSAAVTADESRDDGARAVPVQVTAARSGARLWLVLASLVVAAGVAGWRVASSAFTAPSPALASPAQHRVEPPAADAPTPTLTPTSTPTATPTLAATAVELPVPRPTPFPTGAAIGGAAATPARSAGATTAGKPPARRMKRAQPAARRDAEGQAFDLEMMLRDRK